ncbi:MAG: DUF6010 family protein [Gammaproteobacteria bacterium]|nr:DUF6010 family protein [Gammaproteobacteria bacterium]
MTTTMMITGAALAATFIAGTHFALTGHELEVFALFLALTSCVYGGAALTPAGARFVRIELPFVITVFISAILGLVFSPVWIAVGYFLHGGWDVLHHVNKVETPIVRWFPPLCAVFDAVVGGVVLAWWLF